MKWSRFRKIWSGSWTEKWRSTKKGEAGYRDDVDMDEAEYEEESLYEDEAEYDEESEYGDEEEYDGEPEYEDEEEYEEEPEYDDEGGV